ncbi:MAG: amidase [Planctomycetes bacterium]|nr:amidase [Planctomycetota bacterium]
MPHGDRREFLLRATAVAAAGASLASASGAPAGPGGTPITDTTLAEAEKLAGIAFTETERAQILRTVGELRTQLEARGKSALELREGSAPAEVFRAALPGQDATPVTATGDPAVLPLLKIAGDRAPTDDELAWAGIPTLAAMLRTRMVSSERLARLALDRLERLNPTLLCAITVMREQAIERARAMDAELAAGRVRGPLHGIPWAAKDILDTKGVRTTWGAEPWKDRVPDRDAWAVDAMDRAGAVLVAKTAVGALAYGDIWFGGRCRNPWKPDEGSSGSSAGSASAVAAGIVPFALGTETLGSIVSPCTRCGTSGLRPTFGRIPRTGCMALVWSMDKIGPIARSAADCGIVLSQLAGTDAGDPACDERPFRWSMSQDARGLRVGFAKGWFDGPAEPLRPALDALRAAGAELVEIEPPDLDPTPLLVPLYCEAAAAFERLTRSGSDDALSWQADEAWPNTFRQSWFIPAIEMVQCSRYRRAVMERMHAWFGAVDAVVCPPFAGNLLTITNATGHPCAVARAGFGTDGMPLTMTVMSRLFDEGTALRAAQAIEERLAAGARRPAIAS